MALQCLTRDDDQSLSLHWLEVVDACLRYDVVKGVSASSMLCCKVARYVFIEND